MTRECLWVHQPKARRSVTVTFEPVPEERAQTYYQTLSAEELLTEIKTCIGSVSFSRNQMQKEMRLRLLPALLELKKRTFRKKPSYYDYLKKINLNPDTVRQWFYRSNTADEAINVLEEETTPPVKPPVKQCADRDSVGSEALLLEHADRMARAVLKGNFTNAKKLATQYVEARNESRA
jgi:hypothetical protein